MQCFSGVTGLLRRGSFQSFQSSSTPPDSPQTECLPESWDSLWVDYGLEHQDFAQEKHEELRELFRSLPAEVIEMVIEFVPVVVQEANYQLVHRGPRWYEGHFRTDYNVVFPQGVHMGAKAVVYATFHPEPLKSFRARLPTLKYIWDTEINSVNSSGISLTRGCENGKFEIKQKVSLGRLKPEAA
jgi:hypothetical protein